MTAGQKARVNAFLSEIRAALAVASEETVPNSIVDVQLGRIGKLTSRISDAVNGGDGQKRKGGANVPST